MIYVTGDLHDEIDMHKLTVQAFPEQRKCELRDNQLRAKRYASEASAMV